MNIFDFSAITLRVFPMVHNVSIKSSNITEHSVYDDNGAAIYIGVVIVFYSIALLLTLIRSVLNGAHLDESAYIFKRLYHSHEREHIIKKLKDPEERRRWWKIYYGEDEKFNDRKDHQTVNKLKQQLKQFSYAYDDLHLYDQYHILDGIFVYYGGIPAGNRRSFVGIKHTGSGIKFFHPFYNY
ncbi:unnamed protein product [Didymodactylos carnosus]|uniref:Uncharacterized protein n=1 Tax=Didymodactylos carnosus TaxID=1234261 RepID=A0A815ISQ0_9BILA|nr:unnamed protein product [Didymodactylos carnosus]CAF1369724.1 unnamed protein product [Didymodactylos carnosus]CAF3804642.1 unnamed protein product [Didymodactylos carnosus]CAF4254928.1 unnamed protein product [Didymodactylos carnosus]